MPATYEPIATVTLTAAASHTFSSIPATYTDIRLVYVGTMSAADNIRIQMNGDTSALYSRTSFQGNGTVTGSNRFTGGTYIYPNNALSTTIPSMFTFDLFSYAGSTFKTALYTFSSDRNGSGVTENGVSLYRSTSAITSLSIANSPTYTYTGTATLYGIKSA
jgi:hypothetical protein